MSVILEAETRCPKCGLPTEWLNQPCSHCRNVPRTKVQRKPVKIAWWRRLTRIRRPEASI